jgi:hypothetical protein
MKNLYHKQTKPNSTVSSSPETQHPQVGADFGLKPLIKINGAAARTKGNYMDHPKEKYYWIYPKP